MELREHDVHVWRTSLAEQPPFDCWTVLSAAERDRALRLRFERDRQLFILTRATLRKLISHYTGCAADLVAFEYSDTGKPGLPRSFGLHFNLSHSAGVAILALGREALGVDIEALRPMPDALTIARRFFAPSEFLALEAVEPELREKAFLRCWTRKEAYIKARGEGMSRPLNSFAVTIDPDTPQLLLSQAEPQNWELYNLDPGQGFVAALVAARNAKIVQHGFRAKLDI